MPDREIKHNILATLAYFDIFHYPLTQKEIHLFLSSVCDQAVLQKHLREMTANKYIHKFNGFYCLEKAPELYRRRAEGYNKALLLLKTAEKVASLLSLFPYVRGIAVSGSLSKYYADERSDIDFFIITAGNRLWLARTFTHLLKKLSFLVRKQHLFCMNYYIDEQHLEIEEKNIFTATEIVTLLPMKGTLAFETFYSGNKWVRSFLPNHFMRVSQTEDITHTFIKRLIEGMLNNRVGDMLETILMRLTSGRWNKKTAQNKLNDRGVTMSMSASKYYSKPDPVQFQAKLLDTYVERLNKLPQFFPQTNNVIVSH